MCGKGNERHKAGMVNQVWYTEAALLRTKVAGEVYFLDKGLFMGTTWKQEFLSTQFSNVKIKNNIPCGFLNPPPKIIKNLVVAE
jgi:hypothetical protein